MPLKIISLLVLLAGCSHTLVSAFNSTENQDIESIISHNRVAVDLPDWLEMINITVRFIFEDQGNQTPNEPIQVKHLNQYQLNELPDNQISAIRFGHSTVLLKINGEFWLTDPVFSESLGPVYFMGPKRFHETPITIENLPQIKGVIISHNHYDHMDEKTIKAMHSKVQNFLVPLGNKQTLIDWGVTPEKITELDWWQSKTIDDIKIIATPANHISGRMLFDLNDALWSSWVMITDTKRVFFSGDGGYSDNFKQIGHKFGPFDLAIIENGSYDESWKNEHLTPEESVQAHKDLKGKVLLPVHNSTFDLAFHPWNEPLKRISNLAKENAVFLATPRMGEPYTISTNSPENSIASDMNWW